MLESVILSVTHSYIGTLIKSNPKNFFIDRYQESYKKEILNFVNSINGEVVNYANADDGLHALKAGLAAKNSLQNNCVETVN